MSTLEPRDFAGVADALAQGVIGTPQQGTGAYQSWPTRPDLRNFFGNGGKLLRFSDCSGLLSGRLPKLPVTVNAANDAELRP
ncbi:MAG: hypothetical protein NVSMB10_06550 [Steroidobacteraceae bacterium]